MHWIFKVIFIIIGNAFALWVANLYVPGFVVSLNWGQLLLLAFVLAVLNFLLKPLLTLVLGPIIVLTLGLGILIVNGIILWLLPIVASHIDFLHGSISIQSVTALIIGTIIVSVVNLVIHLVI
jgi:putative membrane protein